MTLALLQMLAQSVAPVEEGAAIFAKSCSVGYCHGSDGAANRGPRLRGRTFEASYVEGVVRKGIPNTAMPAFEGRLREEDLKAVVAWVASISTTTPASGQTAPTAENKPATPPVVPAEFAQGRNLFFDPVRGTRCSTCHELDGRGIQVGPDVRRSLGGVSLVRRFVLRSGETFPGLLVGENGGLVQIYDLTSPPPVLRSVPRVEIRWMDAEKMWTHQQAVANYSPAELAEVDRYLRWRSAAR